MFPLEILVFDLLLEEVNPLLRSFIESRRHFVHLPVIRLGYPLTFCSGKPRYILFLWVAAKMDEQFLQVQLLLVPEQSIMKHQIGGYTCLSLCTANSFLPAHNRDGCLVVDYFEGVEVELLALCDGSLPQVRSASYLAHLELYLVELLLDVHT